MSWNPSPTIGGASWAGNPAIATKNQLLSTSAGIYEDLKDFDFSTISVSTLTVPIWISTPILNVSSIIGIGGIINNNTLQISTGDFSLVSLSTVKFTGVDLGGVNFSFDLGLGNAIGGFLGGLGGFVGGAFIGIGTGTGLAIQGITNGLFSLANTRGDSLTNINQTVFETVNGTTQLQISTLGNAFPLYSSIFRQVSSLSPNQIPGIEEFIPTYFQPGTTCIRAVSDPIPVLTTNSTINTSTIQSFGQWVPFLDPTPTGEDIYGRFATFSTLTLNSDNYTQGPAIQIATSNLVNPVIVGNTYSFPTSNDLQIPFTFYPQKDLWYLQAPLLYNLTEFVTTNTYISTPYVQFQSTLTSQPPTYFITSSISTPAKFIWAGSGVGNFAICQPDETGFRSTATFDFQANVNDLVIQWGLATENRNSTIGVGTAKRVEWDNTANTSNFYDIPVPQSTISQQNLPNGFQLVQTPYETRLETSVPGPQGNGLYLQATTMRVSPGMATTSTSNYNNYNFQFDGSMYVTGVLEANTIIAISSIIATSTNIQTLFSTSLLEADAANIISASITTLNAQYANLQSTNMISTSISTAVIGALTNTNANLQNVSIVSTGIGSAFINTLRANNLLASNIVYSNAEAPYIQTSTIAFGFLGNYVAPYSNYNLQMNVSGPTVYSSYTAASNQTINFLTMSNTVQVNQPLFSTLLQYQQTTYSASNVQGWASTIYANGFTQLANAYLISNVDAGSVSFQAQNAIVNVFMNDNGSGSGTRITVPFGSTYQFTAAGGIWTTTSNPPPGGGIVSYNNSANIFMDFENFTISTTDTLVLNSDVIKILGTTVFDGLEASNIIASNVSANPLTNGFQTNYNKPISIPFNTVPTQVQPLQMTFTEQSPDGVPQYNLIPPFMGSNQFTSYNVSSWNNTMWNNTTAFSLGPPIVVVGDVQTALGSYSGSFTINNTINTSPSYALQVWTITSAGSNLLTSIPGGNYGKISTVDGVNWTTNTNAPNPMASGGNFSNIVTVNQTISQTAIGNTQNLAITAPNISFTTGSMNMYADQIRVNSRRYGQFQSAGIPSFPIGIENNVYRDESMVFSNIPQGLWQSEAVNALVNINGTIFYDANSWIVQIIPSRFRTNYSVMYEWDVEPVVLAISGGPGFCWGFSRLVIVGTLTPGGPGTGTTNYNWYIAIPKNYCTYLL